MTKIIELIRLTKYRLWKINGNKPDKKKPDLKIVKNIKSPIK